MTLKFHDRKGAVIDLQQWVRHMGDETYRLIGNTLIFRRKTGQSKVIVTTWCGKPISDNDTWLPPVLTCDFESVLITDGFDMTPLCGYRTATDAYRGHWDLVQMALEGITDPVIFDDKRLPPVVVDGTVTTTTNMLTTGPEIQGRDPD